MSSYTDYRKDLPTIINYFRPILARLNIRNPEKQDWVCLAEFEYLDFLKLNNLAIKVLVGDIGNQRGMTFLRHSDSTGLDMFYILISEKLYEDSTDLKKAKIIGVHEFCHFMAVLYTLTSTTIEHHRQVLINRLSKKIEKLDSEVLDKIYMALEVNGDWNVDEMKFDDDHYRLQYEGDTENYDILFKHFLFSKELFEEYFDLDKQKEFRNLISTRNEENVKSAINIFMKSIEIAAEAKSVSLELAKKQASKWVDAYL